MYLVCNLKNKQSYDEALKYSLQIKNVIPTKTELVIAPSNIYMPLFQSKNYKLCSQDISSFMDRTITGEVSNEQLSSLGCKYVIVGHSERRQCKNEINIDFINKITNAQEAGLKVIYCIGENLKEYESNKTFSVLEREISEVLNNVSLRGVIIAYEPIWAIGTGKVPKTEELRDTISYIKDVIQDKYEDKVKVLYGGSVNGDNLEELLTIKELDGFLVGGYSLKASNVDNMVNIIEK